MAVQTPPPAGFLKQISEQGHAMTAKDDEMILKTAKEIIVKFIEVGNISPATFHDHFRNIYQTVDATVKASAGPPHREGRPLTADQKATLKK
jgi:uncharacterized protein YaaN involved in tellurite resistance